MELEPIFNERTALKRMITYIEEERSRLWNEYVNITKRLQELDSIEREGQQREKSKSISIEQAIEEHNSQYGEKFKPPVEKDNSKIKSDIEWTKYQDSKNKVVRVPTRKSKYRDIRQIAKTTVSILKEEGKPIKSGELISKLKDRGISVTSPYSMINQIMKYEPNIQRVQFGYYQYKW